MNENVILYIIQVHTDLPQVIKLISLLDDGQNKFLINVDPTFYDDIQGCEVYFPCQTRERITVRRGLPITWGGASQMCAWVDAYRHAMLIDGWEFAVMLSGSCVPLVPQHVIRNHLHADNERGVRVHCFRWDWEISSSNFYSVPIENPASMLADCVETSIGGRIPALICRDLLDFIQNDNSSPILHAHRRGEIVCIDNLVEKKLIIRGLLPHEIARRSYLLSRFPVSGGWLWATFRRDALNDLLNEPALLEIMEMLSTFICSDELFLPTLLRSSSAIKPHEISYWNFHLNLGSPHDLTIHDLDHICHSDAFFARKVDYRKNPDLIRAIEEKISSYSE